MYEEVGRVLEFGRTRLERCLWDRDREGLREVLEQTRG